MPANLPHRLAANYPARRRQRIGGVHARLAPDMTMERALGGVMSHPGLDLVTRQLVLIASCVTLGSAEPQVRAHTEAAPAALQNLLTEENVR